MKLMKPWNDDERKIRARLTVTKVRLRRSRARARSIVSCRRFPERITAVKVWCCCCQSQRPSQRPKNVKMTLRVVQGTIFLTKHELSWSKHHRFLKKEWPRTGKFRARTRSAAVPKAKARACDTVIARLSWSCWATRPTAARNRVKSKSKHTKPPLAIIKKERERDPPAHIPFYFIPCIPWRYK